MKTSIATQTAELRFVKHKQGLQIVKILQQKWIVREETENGVLTTMEWRDVPLVVEEEKT